MGVGGVGVAGVGDAVAPARGAIGRDLDLVTGDGGAAVVARRGPRELDRGRPAGRCREAGRGAGHGGGGLPRHRQDVVPGGDAVLRRHLHLDRVVAHRERDLVSLSVRVAIRDRVVALVEILDSRAAVGRLREDRDRVDGVDYSCRVGGRRLGRKCRVEVNSLAVCVLHLETVQCRHRGPLDQLQVDDGSVLPVQSGVVPAPVVHLLHIRVREREALVVVDDEDQGPGRRGQIGRQPESQLTIRAPLHSGHGVRGRGRTVGEFVLREYGGDGAVSVTRGIICTPIASAGKNFCRQRRAPHRVRVAHRCRRDAGSHFILVPVVGEARPDLDLLAHVGRHRRVGASRPSRDIRLAAPFDAHPLVCVRIPSIAFVGFCGAIDVGDGPLVRAEHYAFSRGACDPWSPRRRSVDICRDYRAASRVGVAGRWLFGVARIVGETHSDLDLLAHVGRHRRVGAIRLSRDVGFRRAVDENPLVRVFVARIAILRVRLAVGVHDVGRRRGQDFVNLRFTRDPGFAGGFAIVARQDRCGGVAGQRLFSVVPVVGEAQPDLDGLAFVGCHRRVGARCFACDVGFRRAVDENPLVRVPVAGVVIVRVRLAVGVHDAGRRRGQFHAHLRGPRDHRFARGGDVAELHAHRYWSALVPVESGWPCRPRPHTLAGFPVGIGVDRELRSA